MKITKGYLTKKYELKPGKLVIALCLWILSSCTFYAFFQVFREVFRVFTAQSGGRALLVLTPGEHYIYNLFHASIASALGYLIALRFTLQNSLSRLKLLVRRTLTTEGLYSWSFLLWFGKLGSLLGSLHDFCATV